MEGENRMKLSYQSIQNQEAWKGYHLPAFDPAEIAENTRRNPQWLHFGSGNIFRIFPAALCQKLIEQGKMDTGIVCCESYDDEVITKCFRPYDNLTIAVTLNADGKLDKEVIGSMADSLTMLYDAEKIAEIFKQPSLQMVSFTITSLPERFKSCLGVFCRESGQKRVPPPPAMITPYTCILFIPLFSPFHPVDPAALWTVPCSPCGYTAPAGSK